MKIYNYNLFSKLPITTNCYTSILFFLSSHDSMFYLKLYLITFSGTFFRLIIKKIPIDKKF